MSKKSKGYDSAYKLEICKSVESGAATVAKLIREKRNSRVSKRRIFQKS